MLEILDESAGKVIGIRVSDKLTHDDFEVFVPVLESAIAAFGPVRLLVRMEGLPAMEPAAVWDKLKLKVRHFSDFERMAVVGDKKWLEWWTKLAGGLVKTDVRHFHGAEIGAAWAWLRA